MNQNDMNEALKKLLEFFDKSQWQHQVNFDLVKNFPIMSREDLQNKKMEKGFFEAKTSGSTGESVVIQKTQEDFLWYAATNIRELLWRKWDVTKTVCTIKPNGVLMDKPNWGLPKFLFPQQGSLHSINYKPINEIQKWLEEKNPHYIHCLPSIFNQLDLSKVTNYIDHKGTGELGGSMYSSEECGTIAIQCPDNKSVFHVMENQIVETDIDGGIIISTLTNKYLRRYKHGDHIQLGNCSCGRSLQTITKIQGRVRNMFKLPNGDKKWPLIGSLDFYSKFGIKRFKAIQTNIQEIELQIISNNLGEREEEVKTLVKKMLESPVDITIKYVDSFPNYKFEEFVCLI
jgi:phenylacetate-CoA ligase